MKNRIIRRATFETNSSSCHSLSMTDDIKFNLDIPSELFPNKEGVTIIPVLIGGYDSSGESDSITKVLYLCTTLILKTSWVKYKDLFLKNLETNLDWSLLVELIKRETGAKEVRLIPEALEEELIRSGRTVDSVDTYGVDHDSFDLLDDISGDPIAMYKYLFNPESIIAFDYNG